MVIFNILNGGSAVLILATIFNTYVRGEDNLQDKNRTCVPSEAEPTLNSSSCNPLVNFTRPFCQNHEIMLDSYIFRTQDYQIDRNEISNTEYDKFVAADGESKVKLFFNMTITRECKRAYFLGFCRQTFPRCDRTSSVFQEQLLCRETCHKLVGTCGKLFKLFKQFYLIGSPKEKRLSCEFLPYRNAGHSPECWYYNELADTSIAPNWTANAVVQQEDCLHLNGSSYHGNISVTASSITCQSWTEQCPHRHTMNTTYPELNLAKNYCRNPQNSGQRPWCFTTDRNTRWEYCDIPKCIPVDGNYGNLSLNITCNVTCGRGFETWRRECDNPEPKFGGRNCSHLGEAVQYRPCLARKRCPVNGGYGNWTLSTSCNVSCGEGVEIWRRTCDNPEPKYGGRNCSELGDWTEFRDCSKNPCPIDGNYGNWTKSSPCSVTCGQGAEIWTRECDNPPGKYGGNCSKQGEAYEIRQCEMVPCPGNHELALFTGSTCIPAEDEPDLNHTDCQPSNRFNSSFCEHFGFKLEKYVNMTTSSQAFDVGPDYLNFRLWISNRQYDEVISKGQNFPTSKECWNQARFFGCYVLFQGCDRTTSVFKMKKICKQTCIDFTTHCKSFLNSLRSILNREYIEWYYISTCLRQPSPQRNAGESPECVFYKKKESLEKEDCLRLNGSSYHGNISVTASGITCQSWTEQCPHRHTMNTTYPELNLAKNYCRNPQNSGQRPWCFTTDRNKRWEYCDIPKCIPVDGNYGNWSLNSSCSVTCGHGVEIWRRECNNPQPKFGGRNCNQLGKTTKYINCTRKPCVVNGNYSSWYLSSKCNVTCGEGLETWRRSCDNPAPSNGGQNCSVLGEEMEYRICRRQPCPINGNYSNWVTSSACSVTCGKGYEIWSRRCDNPLPKYGGADCSKYGVNQDTRPCHNEPCPVKSSSKTISISCGVCASIIVLVILVIGIRRRVLTKRSRRRSFPPYATTIFGSRLPKRTGSQTTLIDATTGERIYESIEEINTSERIYESIDDIIREIGEEGFTTICKTVKTSRESSTGSLGDEVA